MTDYLDLRGNQIANIDDRAEFWARDAVGTTSVDTLFLPGEKFLTQVSYDTGNVDYNEIWSTREAALAGHDRILAAIRDRGYATGPETWPCPRCAVDAYYGTAEFGHCGACHYPGTEERPS